MNNFEDYLLALLGKVAEWKASDLYLTTGAAPSVRVQGVFHRLDERNLQAGQTRGLAYQMISADQIASAVGSGTLGNMASQLGLDPAQVSGQLAQMLPGIIDRLTPNGALPEGGLGQPADLMGMLGGLLNKS